MKSIRVTFEIREQTIRRVLDHIDDASYINKLMSADYETWEEFIKEDIDWLFQNSVVYISADESEQSEAA